MSDFTANFASTDLFRSASDSVRTLVRAVKSNVRSRADKHRWAKADKKAMQPVNLSIRAMQTAENAEFLAQDAQTELLTWKNNLRHMQTEMAYLKSQIGNQGWQIQQQRGEILRLQAELEYERVIRDEMAEAMATNFRSAARGMDAAAEQMEGVINDRCQAIMPGVYADPVAALDAMCAANVPAGWEYAG